MNLDGIIHFVRWNMEVEGGTILQTEMLVGAVFLLFVIQVIGTHLQVKAYKGAVREMHKLGNVGIGSRRRKLGASNIVVIACNSAGEIGRADHAGHDDPQPISSDGGYCRAHDLRSACGVCGAARKAARPLQGAYAGTRCTDHTVT